MPRDRRPLLPGAVAPLWVAPQRGAEPSGRDARRRPGDVLHHGISLRRDTQGVLSGAGHRNHPGRHPSGPRHSLRQDGRASAGLGQGDLGGFGRRKPVLVHRRRRLQRHAQLRPFPHQSQAAREAQIERQRDHPPFAAGDRRHRRHFAVHAAGAGPVDRHRGQRHPISVHAGKSGSPDVADLDADGAGAPRQGFPKSSTSPAICSPMAVR